MLENENLMFSVIVITYNQEKYISQTLDSILTQEHDYKYEIVIGEDCSTDGTRKIVEEYAAKYPEIIRPLYNNPNKGLVRNYFETAAECNGKYIMECAGDDWWLPGKVKTQIEFMESHPDVGMCYGKAKCFNQKESIITAETIGEQCESFEELIQINKIPALTVCIKHSEFNTYVTRVDPKNKPWIFEDYPIWLWLSIKSKIQFIDKEVAVYRILEDSLSHFISSKAKAKKFLKSQNKIKNYFLIKVCRNPILLFKLWIIQSAKRIFNKIRIEKRFWRPE